MHGCTGIDINTECKAFRGTIDIIRRYLWGHMARVDKRQPLSLRVNEHTLLGGVVLSPHLQRSQGSR